MKQNSAARGCGIRSLIIKNILRNKKNSFLIVFLITVITFLFFIGNSIIGGSDRALRDAYINSLTGDVVLQKTMPVTMNLFGANTPVIDAFFTIPELPAFDRVWDIALSEPGLGGLTSQVSTKAFLDVLGVRSAVLVCGVDAAGYFDTFPGIVLEEGRFLTPGEYGAMITVERAQQILDSTGTYPEIGTPLLLTAAGTAGFKIREVPLFGIYRYQNTGPLMNEIIIADPQTVRILAAIQVASSDVWAGDEALDLLDVSLDELFWEDSGEAEIPSPVTQSPDVTQGLEETLGPEETVSPDSIAAYLGSFTEDSSEPLQGGGWNFIILRLKPGTSAGRFIAALNKKLNPMGVTAVSWRIAAGNSAILLFLIQSFFNGGIFLMSAAGIIAAINILLISVFKRTSEIGTLRAIGAGDGYIRTLVLGENVVLSCAAGLLGILAGFWCIRTVNGARIGISNSVIAPLLGGSVLNLHFIPSVAAASFGVALFLGFVASIVPVETAVRVDPIVAVRQG